MSLSYTADPQNCMFACEICVICLIVNHNEMCYLLDSQSQQNIYIPIT